jgi:hypothetical protein
MLIKAREFRVSPHALMFDPQFYVYDIALKNKLTKFLVVEETHLDLAPFIDIRFEPMSKGYFSLPTRELFALEKQHQIERPRSSFIFHHAFVCSTLLARCLNQIDAFFSLKEPWILRRLADIKRAPGSRVPDSQWKQLFTTHIMLLAKNYRTGKLPVIKATNVANNLLVDVLRFLPDHKSLYLYSDLKSFLVSNLKKPEDTRKKMPGLAKGFINDEDFARKFPSYCEINQLSFLQVCALIWVVSLYNLRANVEPHQSHQVRTLDMNVFLEKPADTVRFLSEFYSYHPDSDEVAKMVSPDVLETNAKQQSQSYSKEVRQAEAHQLIRSHHKEIERTLGWINPLVQELRLLDFVEKLRLF